MVRIARREEFSYETARTSGDQPLIAVHTDHHVVGGVNHDALSGNNKRKSDDHHPLASCCCIADKCAMWRWAPNKDRVGAIAPTLGYCGLAPMHGAAS